MSALARPAGILATALCTPLGFTTEITLAERAAGTLRFVETEAPGLGDTPVRACRTPLLPTDARRTDRMIALAVTALASMGDVLAARHLSTVPLFLGLPHRVTGADFDEARVVTEIERALPAQARLGHVSRYREGRAAFFTALNAGLLALASPQRPRAVLVGGLDSQCDPASLAALVAEGRILGQGTIDGLIPGEGAGVILLAPPGQKGEIGRVLGCSLADDPRPFTSSEPALAEGLSAALRELGRDVSLTARRPDRVLSCQTGETFWATELSRAYLRNAALMPEPMINEYSAAAFGDAGAASGALLFAAAAAAQPGSRSLVYGCSDEGAVGAAMVEASQR